MNIVRTSLAVFTLGFGFVLLTSPNYAQEVSAARAAALRECNLLVEKYPIHIWSNSQLYMYRGCMAEHGQQE